MMSTAELKIEVINRIVNISDQIKLKDLLQLLKFQSEESIFITNDEEKSAIFEARKEIVNGNTFSNEDVQKEINEWLRK